MTCSCSWSWCCCCCWRWWWCCCCCISTAAVLLLRLRVATSIEAVVVTAVFGTEIVSEIRIKVGWKLEWLFCYGPYYPIFIALLYIQHNQLYSPADLYTVTWSAMDSEAAAVVRMTPAEETLASFNHHSSVKLCVCVSYFSWDIISSSLLILAPQVQGLFS